jgi:D-alanyl-D-alanine carboxypeptidase/D-alanyl-D-alanine-endopeptidase (penicillin-binding protein 4)
MRIPAPRRPSLVSVFLVAAGMLLASSGFTQDLPQNVTEAFRRAGIPLASVGAWVQRLQAGPAAQVGGPDTATIALNDGLPFNPASTMKLVTSAAALEILGPAYTWKTRAYADGPLVGGELQGDLFIKGSGDPRLVQENLWLFLRQLRDRGIRDIRGDLVLDSSLFEPVAYDPAQFDGDPLRAYNAGSDALLLNYKAFAFRFVPDAPSGIVKVMVDPPVAGYPLAAPRLGTDECGDWKGKLGAAFGDKGASFAGGYSASCGERTWYVHPWQMSHAQYFGVVFRQIWRDLGGTLAGNVRNGVVSANASQVGQWESTMLPEAVRDMNKFSNNVMARQILLTIATETTHQSANSVQGAQAIGAWLAGKGIDTRGLAIENGAGLSRNERITPRTLGRILAAMFQSPLMPEFISSLPLVGVDGTMRRRLNGRSVNGNAHIKTGSLNEVRTVAGYVLAASGRRYVVVCMVNDARASLAQEAQDALLQWVYEAG